MDAVVSFSGGKDSTAMLLRMIELGYTIDTVIFADTTLEYPEMYDWIAMIESMIPHKITRVTASHSFDSWFYGVPKKGRHGSKGQIRGFPLECFGCWWQRDCKSKPIKKYIGSSNIVYVGIASDESERAEIRLFRQDDNTYKFPLIDWGWTEQDCIDYLDSKRLSHPLVTKFKRTGCWLCPKQSRQSLKNLYLNYPVLWSRLKKYEQDSPNGFKFNFSLARFEDDVKAGLV